MRRLKGFIYYHEDWPKFQWDANALITSLAEVRHLQGKLIGKMRALGFNLQNEAYLLTLSQDIIKSSEIEGEILDNEQVRSSIARRLGMDVSGLIDSDKDVDGVVDMMLDATKHHQQALSEDRLFGWHSSLFPAGRSGMYSIITGDWRDDSTGPMQVVSGAMGKEKVHFQAPEAQHVPTEMEAFFQWINSDNKMDLVLQAGVAHLWFVTIHPFEDGNGRIARAITDMLLSRSENSSQRFYSMSAQVRKERKAYYEILEYTQKRSVNITPWMSWFLETLRDAIIASDAVIDKVLEKHQFWLDHQNTVLNERQLKVINRLLTDFKGKLNTSKWAKMNQCSKDTALRDIQDLMTKQILKKEAAGGRSTNYEIIT